MGRPATLKVDIVTNAKTGGIDQAQSRLGKFGGIARKAGAAAAVGLAAVGTAAAGVAVATVKSASRQQQAFGALDSIYGKNSAQVKAWAQNAAGSVGLAASEYAELSSVVGAQLQGMGMETAKSAKQTDKLISKGADLAATFGGSVTEAVSAVSSLMKGERDPIERYGVSIKQADIEAEKAALGLQNLTGKAAKQAEATATLSLLNKQTAKTTGAFSRESNTLAGQQERLRAKFENVKATIGNKLLPVATKLFTWLSDKLLPGAMKLGGALADRLGPSVSKVGAFISGKLVPAAQRIHSWFVEQIAPGIRSTLTPILQGLRSAFGSVTDAVRRNSGNLSKIRGVITKVFHATQPLRQLLAGGLKVAFTVVGAAIGGVISVLARLIGWLDSALSKLSALKNAASGGLGKVADFLGLSGPPLAGRAARLVGQGPSYSPGGQLAGFSWSTAASSTTAGDVLAASSTGRAQVVEVDNSLTVTVQGALDPAAVARQIEQLLRQHRTRTGRAPKLQLSTA